MSSEMKFLIGLDPGGTGNFGWCVVKDAPKLPRWTFASDLADEDKVAVFASGLADDSEAAVSAARASIPPNGQILAAGIDAPLFWSRTGRRNADVVVRAAIREAGARYASGTVQNVNSLRGACLVQGMLAALKLRELYPKLPITEAHPKALLALLPELKSITAPSEHQRDALFSAVAAWATVHEQSNWKDLLLAESSHYTPVTQPLHYFMPRLYAVASC
jgi:hypothetical protein